VVALRAVRVPRTVGVASWLVIVTLAAAPAPIAAQRAQPTDRIWRAPDIALASVFTLALWIDAAQTRQGIRRGYDETNPILGRHPTVGLVNAYTAVVGLTTLGVAAATPARARPWLLAAASAVEAFAISRNVQAGIALTF
jgi:hypothetical protein